MTTTSSGQPSAPPPDVDPIPIEETCCGKCHGATCYVDYLTGERP